MIGTHPHPLPEKRWPVGHGEQAMQPQPIPDGACPVGHAAHGEQVQPLE